jgi:predicted nucleic acid-binding protein
MPATVWDTATRLSRKHSAILGSRSLDVLQVATALVFGADAFLTFDRRQMELAKREGLNTLPD